jgi:signal transduction histidine kinase
MLNVAVDQGRSRTDVRRLFAGLRFRLLFLVLLAFGPMLGLVLYTYSEQMQQATLRAEDEALRLARLAAIDQQRLIDGARQLLVAVAQLPSVQNFDAAICEQFLSHLLKQYPLYENIGAVTTGGDIYCSAVPFPTAINVGDRPWYLHTIRSRGFVAGDYIVSRITGKPILATSYPVVDDAGHMRAVVFAGIDLQWLDEFVAQAQLPAGSTVTLVDHSGIVLTRYPDPEGWRGQSLPAELLEPLIAQGEGVADEIGLDGVRRLYAFTGVCCLASGDIYLRVGIPSDVALAEPKRDLTRNLATFGGMFLVCLAMAWGGSSLFVLRPLDRILDAIRRFDAGDLGARTNQAHVEGELSQLAHAFDEMAATVEAREIERDRTEDALRQEQRARAALLNKTISAQEDERKRVARELHDQTSQDLAALMLSLDTCALDLATKGPRLDQHLHTAKSIAESMLTNVHHLINDLRPSLLDDLGLAPAILWYGERRLKPMGVILDFRCDRVESRLPPSLETALFRITQEALTNVVRHADATRAQVTLEVDNAHVFLTVQDDGTGLKAPAAGQGQPDGRGLGLRGMRERVITLGGQLGIESAPGEGTTIKVDLPLPKKEEEFSAQDPRLAG